MRINFQGTPWDLYISLGYTIFATFVLLATTGGTFLAIIFVFLAPGYVVVAALFPRETDLGWMERFAISFGLSVAIVPLLGLALSFSIYGIHFAPLVELIALFVVLISVAAYWRRIRLPTEERLSATLELTWPEWQGRSFANKILTIAVATGVILATLTLAFVIVTPRAAEQFSEFYLLGPTGNASGYRNCLNISEADTVVLGVANHEFASVIYTVRVDAVGVRLIYNTSRQQNETVEVNRTTQSWLNVTLAREQDWRQPYTFQISDAGMWKIQLFLFRNGEFSSPLRELHFFVRVPC